MNPLNRLAFRFGHRKEFLREREPLWDFISSFATVSKCFLEIGLGTGENALEVLQRFRWVRGYFVVDLPHAFGHEEERRIRKECLAKLLEDPRFHLFTGDSKSLLPWLHLPPLDLVFIDGGHDYETVKSDWENVQKYLHARSVVVFDDYHLPDVQKAVHEIDGWKKKRLGNMVAVWRFQND